MKAKDDIERPNTFAPVIIPTLCRFEHFKQCIESLMKCTWAGETDVYIGIDYPIKKAHWDGYGKICKYIDEIKTLHTFKSLNIIKREKNYGCGSNGNLVKLKEYVFSFSDRLIVSEDDNVFSPAFLDYINKGLEIYQNNKDVIAICGYRNFYNFKFKNNTIAKQNVDFVAWGYGYWKDRAKEIQTITPQWFRSQFTLKKFYDFCKSNGNYRGLCWLQYALRPMTGFYMPDDGISVYMGLCRKYTIMPFESLVKNIGTDGSGEHFKKHRPQLNQALNKQKVYAQETFVFTGNPNEFFQENMRENVKCAYKRISTSIFPFKVLQMFFDKSITLLNRKLKNVFQR